MRNIAGTGQNSLYKTIFGYDIFISYSRRDSLDYAYSIAESFMKKGYECYIDQLSSISPGKELPATIKTAVAKATSLVLVGSVSARLSEPIENEITLFLKHNKNKPLIPITIDGSINEEARWFKYIEGLALISENTENLRNGTPSGKVLERIENGLLFTKKSRRLRNVALGTVISILLLIGSAAFYTIMETRKAADANRSMKAATLREKNARIAAANAEQNRNSALKTADSIKAEIRLTKISLDNANNKLVVSLKQEQLVSRKNKAQQYLYQAQSESANGHMNEAFAYGKKALEIEKEFRANNAKYVLIDYLNNYSSKQLKNTDWPFNFNHYDFYEEHGHEIQDMRFFDMNEDKTEVIAYTVEPKLDGERRLAVYPFDPPVTTWGRKKFDFGLLDLKGDSSVMVYDKYGYFFGYSSLTNKYYFITDDSLNSDRPGGALTQFVLDDHLNVLNFEYVNRPAGQYLGNITNRAEGLVSDYTYVHSFSADDKETKINLVHFGDPTSLTEVTIDSSCKENPNIHTLDSFDKKLDPYVKLESIKMFNNKIYYATGNSIFEKDIHSNAEQRIFKSIKLPDSLVSKGEAIRNFVISPLLNVGFIMDTVNFISMIKKTDSGWQHVGSFKAEHGVDSFELDEQNRYLVLKNQFRYSYCKIDEMEKEINTEYTQRFGLNTTGKTSLFPDKMNFHIYGNSIVDNNNSDVQFKLRINPPTHSKFTEANKTLVSLDSRTGKLSVNDLSNVFLTGSIPDDAGYKQDKFQDLDTYDSLQVYRGTKLVVTDDRQLRISRRSKTDIVISDTYVSKAGFLNSDGLIYYCSGDEVVGSPLIDKFNVYDINTGYKATLYLNSFFNIPSYFEITDKYIYFSESDFSDKVEKKKMVRFINPAISIQSLKSFLRKSFFN